MQLQVFGRPSQIMGGLFKFIDGVTNENCEGGKRGDAALIVAHVNEVRDWIFWYPYGFTHVLVVGWAVYVAGSSWRGNLPYTSTGSS